MRSRGELGLRGLGVLMGARGTGIGRVVAEPFASVGARMYVTGGVDSFVDTHTVRAPAGNLTSHCSFSNGIVPLLEASSRESSLWEGWRR